MSPLQQQQQHTSWSQQDNNLHHLNNNTVSSSTTAVSASGSAEDDDIDNDDDEGNSSSAPVRKRTRATADQLSVLEDTFSVNVSPNSKLRKQLAEQLQMSERSIQIWFQNRRAKVKHMQKRAQMQMHQASIRAQLYQYHQQQQQQHHHQQSTILPMQQQQHPYYYNTAARLTGPPRAQSLDAVQYSRMIPQQQMMSQHHHHHQQQQLYTPASSVPPHSSNFSVTPPPMSYPQYYQGNSVQPSSSWLSSSTAAITTTENDLPLTRQSMPPQVYPSYDFNSTTVDSSGGLEFPEYLHGQVSPSPSHKQTTSIPTLVSVPDAGPTAVLVSSIHHHHHNSPSPSSPDSTQVTINPSSLMIQGDSSVTSIDGKEDDFIVNSTIEEEEQKEDEEPKDLYLSATTLTIGTWHRLKMHETDLVCVYRPDTRIFAWHIVDGGCHFKMEVAQDAVSSIECVLDEHEALADVHFDISEPPLFYMESTTTTTTTTLVETETDKKKNGKKTVQEPPTTTTTTTSPVWVQCSDFTEGKQASRFFRHSLKGIAPHMKQELLALVHNHEETRRLVHFIENPAIIIHGHHHQHHHPHGGMIGAHHAHHAPPPPVVYHHHPATAAQHHYAGGMTEDHLIMQNGFMNPNTMYWNPHDAAMPSELYMS